MRHIVVFGYDQPDDLPQASREASYFNRYSDLASDIYGHAPTLPRTRNPYVTFNPDQCGRISPLFSSHLLWFACRLFLFIPSSLLIELFQTFSHVSILSPLTEARQDPFKAQICNMGQGNPPIFIQFHVAIQPLRSDRSFLNTRAARVASLMTFRTPSPVSAEHSR